VARQRALRGLAEVEDLVRDPADRRASREALAEAPAVTYTIIDRCEDSCKEADAVVVGAGATSYSPNAWRPPSTLFALLYAVVIITLTQ